MVAGPETTLRRWMVAVPETARLLTEYEEKHSKKQKESVRHYEQMPSVQKTFLAQTKNVTDVIEELGNPSVDTSTDLYTLDSTRIMPDIVVHTIRMQQGCLSGRAPMGAVTHWRARSCIARFMGLEEND